VFPVDRLCSLMVGVPGYRTGMYRSSFEVQTEFIGCGKLTIKKEVSLPHLYMLCRRK
jgi:hypothetical protein